MYEKDDTGIVVGPFGTGATRTSRSQKSLNFETLNMEAERSGLERDRTRAMFIPNRISPTKGKDQLDW